MSRLASLTCRAGLAGATALVVLAVLRWGPVFAEPPWDVRALPLALPTLLLAVGAALTGRERRPWRLRPLLLALALAATALAAVVRLRGAAGLGAEAQSPHGGSFRLAPGPVDITGDELDALPRSRRWTLAWRGELRVPETGTYRLWAQGSGAASVAIDEQEMLAAEGDPFRGGTDRLLGRGVHELEVRLESGGSGPRLRLGWTRPRRGGRPGGRDETIPPRALGPARPAILWWLTDALALAVAALAGLLAAALPWDRPRRLAPLPEPTRRELAVSLLGHAALFALMSWPLVLDPLAAGPFGKSDGRLNAWILAWDVHALLHRPLELFQAPIFHPLPDALAFSENLLLPAVIVSPATLLGGPALGYNLALLLSCVVSGLGAQVLARRAGADPLAAFVGGAAFGVGAHRWFRMAHLHAQVTLFLPFALLALDRFWERRTLRSALLVGLLLGLQGLASIYLGAITAVTLVAGAALAAAGGLRKVELARLGLGLALAAALSAPILRPYLRMRSFQGKEFTLAEEAAYATTPESYAASSTRLYGPIAARHLDPQRVHDPLFPGLALLALGIAGLASAPPRYRAVAVVASALAVLLSLGPATPLYRILHEHVVLFRGIRALERFSLVGVLALSVLAGLALAGRGRRWSLLALALLLAEASHLPLRYAACPVPSDASRWLAGKPGALVSLPLAHERDTVAMLKDTIRFRPLVNGDSGFIPRYYDRALERLEEALGADALRFLRGVGVTQVVARDEPELPLLARFGEERIYGVPAGDAARPVRLDARAVPTPTLWGADGVEVELAEPAVVGSVAFELSDAPWVEAPGVAVSTDGVRWESVDARASLADAALSLASDPRHGLGELRFAPRRVRFLRVDPRLPARRGALWVAP